LIELILSFNGMTTMVNPFSWTGFSLI